MGSFDEENLYDFVEPESKPQPLTQSPFHNDHHSANYYILQEIVESVTNAEIVILEYLKKKFVDGGEFSALKKKKWLVKCFKKDGYNASLCQTYWPTTINYPGGEYEYIDILCKCKRGGVPLRVILDVDFKSQFEVARPTSNYKKLCDMLPQIFVGDEQKLNKIISILCGEANNSFRERGLHVPPWRTPFYMHSKWFSPAQKLPSREVGVVVASSKLSPVGRRKYLGADQCGLSNEFSAMTTKCS